MKTAYLYRGYNKHNRCITRVYLLALVISAVAVAQTSPVETRPQRGFLPNSENILSGLDSVNTVNGNLALNIPLASLPPGRAGHGFSLDLIYNSHLYDIAVTSKLSPLGHSVYANELTPGLTGGWKYNFKNIGVEIENRTLMSIDMACSTPAAGRTVRLRVGLQDGSQHVLHLRGYGSEVSDGYIGDGYYAYYPDGRRTGCEATRAGTSDITGRLTYYTSDGTFLKLEIEADGTSWENKQWTLYFPDGARMVGHWTQVETIVDANGNTVSIRNRCKANCTETYTEIADEHGRAITIGSAGGGDDLITVNSAAGVASWTVHWRQVDVGANTEYICGPEGTKCLFSTTRREVSAVDLPTSSATPLSYTFGYDAPGLQHYGELNYMKTPYGAAMTYQYKWANHERAQNQLLDNPVTEKRVAANGEAEQTWQYAVNVPLTASAPHTVTNPDGGIISTYFLDSSSGGKSGLAYKVISPEGDVVERVWANNATWGTRLYIGADPANAYVKQERRSVAKDGKPAKTAITEFDYDKNGNLMEKREYDWVAFGVTTGSTVLRRTVNSYYVPAMTAGDNSGDDPNAYWQPHKTEHWTDPGSARRLNAVYRSEVQQGSTPQAISEFEYDDAYRNGNVTAEKRWDNTKDSTPPPAGALSATNSVVFKKAYDGYGNVTEIYEPAVRTTLTYDDVCGASHLYPTKIEQAPGTPEHRTMRYTWHCGPGLKASQIDEENDNFTTSFGYDQLGRVTDVNEGSVRATATIYDDAAAKVTTKSDLRTFRDGKIEKVTHYDQLARVRLTRDGDGAPLKGDAETDGIKVQIVRKSLSGGNIEIRSSPYRDTSDESMGWTCTQFDRDGRVRYVAEYSGAAAPTTCGDGGSGQSGMTETRYEADTTVAIDQAGKRRDMMRDAAGRVTGVTEYTDGTPATYSTTYTYDAMNNLRGVLQGSQTRTFNYTSLGRLSDVSNPESGQVLYTYYDHGNLKTRTDARASKATHTYDGLHRILTTTYSDQTPSVTHEYYVAGSSPQVGQLKSVTNTTATATYVYDSLGRTVTSTQKMTGAESYSSGYTYLLNDEVASMQYPSGRLVSYTHDDAGRITRVGEATKTFAEAITYAPHGGMKQMQLGNGLSETISYNHKAQVAKIEAKAGGVVHFALELGYTDSAAGIYNNGNVLWQRTTRGNNMWRQDYKYDGINRVSQARERQINTEGDDAWKRDYSYNQWGSMWVGGNTGIEAYSFTPQAASNVDTANRLQIQNADYDAAGNQKAIGAYTFSYDAENHMTSSSISGNVTTYSYDGQGRRVKKGSTVYVYDAFGRVVAEYGEAGPVTDTQFLTADHLGSTRLVTAGGGEERMCYDYEPFGQQLLAGVNGRPTCFGTSVSADAQKRRFTGKERDAETAGSASQGLDFFGARYYSGAQGRFTSPDPLLDSARPEDPQSWNRYAYARNNPLRFVDPTGLNYEDLTERQRKLVDEWAGRQNKANNTSASAETTYNSLTESQRATTEAVLNALENTTIIAADGTRTNALSMIGQIDSIAGRQDGKGGAEQFRLYVTLAEGASATLKDAQNMYSVPGHGSEYPVSRQLRGGEPSFQFSMSADGRTADVDVDYVSKRNPFTLFKHLSPSNSDVRAPGHFDAQNKRFGGTPLRRRYDPNSK